MAWENNFKLKKISNSCYKLVQSTKIYEKVSINNSLQIKCDVYV